MALCALMWFGTRERELIRAWDWKPTVQGSGDLSLRLIASPGLTDGGGTGSHPTPLAVPSPYYRVPLPLPGLPPRRLPLALASPGVVPRARPTTGLQHPFPHHRGATTSLTAHNSRLIENSRRTTQDAQAVDLNPCGASPAPSGSHSTSFDHVSMHLHTGHAGGMGPHHVVLWAPRPLGQQDQCQPLECNGPAARRRQVNEVGSQKK